MKRLSSIISFFILFTSIPFSLYAQKEEVTLEPVVVTATRDIQEIRKVPANVTVITREEIERSHAETTVDLLRNEVSVTVQDFYGTGKFSSVDVRGFGETGVLNTLVLVDGRRVNEIDLSGVDWAQIPLDLIERIEIVRGAGSVLYGDNAVGGVINIITKRPEKPFSANVEVAGGSYHYNKETGSVSGKWGTLSALLYAGHEATKGYRENGFLRAKNVGGKIIYDLNDAIRFNFSGTFHRDEAGLPGGLPRDIYQLHRRSTLRPDDQAQTDDGYGAIGVEAKLWDFGRMEAEFSYRHRQVDDSFPSFSFKTERALSTWGITPRYILEKPLWNHSNKLTLGLDLYQSDSEVYSEMVFWGMTFPNRLEVTKKSTGLFLLDEFSILDHLILSLGYRQEWVTYDLFQEAPLARDRLKENKPAYQVSLNYLFGKKSSAFLSFKRSFRFPVSDELIQFFPTFKVNPFIKPQTGYHYETGIRHAVNDQLETALTLFWMDLRHELFFNPETFANENFPKTRRQGIEVGAKLKPFPWLLIWGNYIYVRPILREDPFSGNDLPWVSRHKGSVGADIQLGKGFRFNTRANITGARHFISDFANRFERVDGYLTLDMKLSYAWKGLKTFVGVNNLLDRKYVEYAAVNAFGTRLFYPSPERNFIGGISYTF